MNNSVYFIRKVSKTTDVLLPYAFNLMDDILEKLQQIQESQPIDDENNTEQFIGYAYNIETNCNCETCDKTYGMYRNYELGEWCQKCVVNIEANRLIVKQQIQCKQMQSIEVYKLRPISAAIYAGDTDEPLHPMNQLYEWPEFSADVIEWDYSM